MLAALADAERFGKAVNAAAPPLKIRGAFATLIGTLLANEAPFAMVRCAMNFGLPKDVDVIPLIPLDIRENEWGDAFKGAAQNDLGELDLDLAFRDELAPPILELLGHVGRKDLLGHLRLLDRDTGELQDWSFMLTSDLARRPIYEKRLGIARRFCVYFWDPSLTKDEQAGSWERGGGGHTFARCVVKSRPDDEVIPKGNYYGAHG
ncbi:hypothetical protein AK812_SmicGene17556 [Symbiodinium microadriaticum]|uniref:Uncharacterized protein n=1 Tax=Symbiodinium microadriaticum TaxID=2951 RepID=A0A1Q9DXF2_SYMMI|nr:hypothetical protein AK812_SmicGene17556 [Symbiodinium microadriaticum]